MLHPVTICFLLMFGIAFAITVGICIADKLRERKVARVASSPSVKFRT